jgi:hypothetical protein
VCDKVREDRRAFQAPVRSAPQPDIALLVPFATLDGVIGPSVKKLGKGRIPLPSVLGQSLGSLTLKVERVRTRAAPAGKVGFDIRVALFDGKSRLLAARIAADVPARFDARRRVLRAKLSDANIKKLDPVLDRKSVRALTAWAKRKLPEPLRSLTPNNVLAGAVESLAKQMLPRLAGELRKDLPKLFASVAAIEIDLSSLPLNNLAVSSSATDLIAAGRSTIGGTASLASLRRNPALPRTLGQLRLAGGTMAGMANLAMKEGEIPERYDLDGSANPQGPLLARTAWEPGPRPMKVHLWKEDGDCVHAIIGATPEVAVDRHELVVSAKDAKLQKVRGSAKVKAGIFFSGVGRRSFEVVERVAATAQLEVANRPVRARVRAAAVSDSEVAVAIALR